jgi:flagellar protein FliL
MTDSTDPAPTKKKGIKLKKLLLLTVVLSAIGGGAAYGLTVTGHIGSHAAKKPDPNPQFVRKGETDPYAPKAAEGELEAEAPEGAEDSGGSPYRVAYYSFSDEFTSNLKDSSSLIQLSLAASTRRDGRVLQRLKKHELAVRSAVLTVLADTDEEQVTTVAGKAQFQRRLTDTINQVLTKNEGFGGVDDVYFKSLLVQ